MRPHALHVALCVSLLLNSCTGAKDDPAKAQAAAADPVETAPTDTAKPAAGLQTDTKPAAGVQTDGSIVSAVDWFEGTLEQALARATQEKKLVFIDVGAYWCPPCHRLDEEVFTVAEVGERLGRDYIAVHVDAEKGDGPEITAQYKVQAYPTLLVLEATGIEKGRIVDFLPSGDLLTALTAIAGGGNVLSKLSEAAVAKPDDMQAQYALGHAYALAANRELAEKQFAIIELADPNDELGLVSKVRYDRAMFLRYKLDDDKAGAIEDLQALQAAFPTSKSATRAYRLIGRLHHLQGNDAEALASLDAMLAKDPKDLGLATNYGWFCFRQNVSPQAGLRVITAAQAQHPDDAETYYLEAELKHLTDDDTGALTAIEKASALEPNSHYYRRQVRRFQGLVGT